MRYVAMRTATTYGVWWLLDFRCKHIKRRASAVDMLALRCTIYSAFRPSCSGSLVFHNTAIAIRAALTSWLHASEEAAHCGL